MLDIRRARKKAGITQETLAKKLNVNRATISKYETGDISPSVEQLQDIANALNVDFFDLLDPVSQKALEEAVDRNEEATVENIKNRYGITGNFVVVETNSKDIKRLIESFGELNEEGQQTAVERVEELTEIDRYKRKEPAEGKDTAKEKEPLQGNTAPNNGK